MKNILNKLIRNEKGQAMPILLILLLIGGLIIGPLLGLMSAGVKAGQAHERMLNRLYAADAGIEDALWKIINDPPGNYPHDYTLTDLNGMPVEVTIDEAIIFYGEELRSGVHYWIMEIMSDTLDPSDPDDLGDYTYRLTLINKHPKNIGVERIMLAFSTDLDYPGGYQVNGLYDGDVDGLNKGSFSDGALTVTESGDTQILTWWFPGGQTKITGASDPADPSTWITVTCILQLVGFDEAPEFSNFMFVADSEDIGTIWEFKPFKITAQADDGSAVATTVNARAVRHGGTAFISYWYIE